MRTLLAAVLVALVPGRAQAHPFDLAALELASQGEVVQVRLECALPVALEAARVPEGSDLSPAGLARLTPALFAATLGSGAMTAEGRPCRWGAPEASVSGIRIQLRAAARCEVAPGALRLTLPFVEERPPTFRILGVATLDGTHLEFQAGPGRETVVLQGPPPSAGATVVRTLASPWTQLPLLLLLVLAVGTSGRGTALALGAALGAMGAGWVLGRAGVSIAPGVLRVALVLALLAPLVEPLLRRAAVARWRLGLLGGAVAGLGLAGVPLNAAGAAAVALGLLGAAALSLLLARATATPGRGRVAAGLLAVLVGAAALLA